MRKTILLFCLLYVSGTLYAQRADNWVFGTHAMLSFSTGQPTSTQLSSMNQSEGSTSISDENGQLLFYSDGMNVWSADHSLMPNGTGLFGHVSSTQSGMIVPFQNDSKRYYLFTTDYQWGTNGLNYSVVNMTLNNGKGDVESRNTQLTPFVREKITSVNHCNGKDTWVITRDYRNGDFMAFLVTSAGIQSPVISASLSTASVLGYLKASPDGTRIADAKMFSSLELFDFNPATGIVSNKKTIMTYPKLFNYGVEFSPDSKILYTSCSRDNIPITSVYYNYVYQFSKLDSTVPVIQSSLTIVDSAIANNFGVFNAMQLAPDGKIYVSLLNSPILSVINNPNQAGTTCLYSRSGPALLTGSISRYGLPDFNQSYVKGSFRFDTACYSNQVKFYYSRANDVQSLKWDFDDPASGAANTSSLDSPSHRFSSPGIYTVKLVTYLPCRNDTFSKKITIDPFTVDLGPDKAICADSLFLLNPRAGAGKQYKWQDNSTLSTLSSTFPGLYWVEVSRPDGSCKTRDSILISSKPNPNVSLGRDSLLCENNTLLLNATNPGATYNWQDNSQAPVFTARKAGRYFVKVDLNGCLATDTIDISTKYLPRVYMVTEAGICPSMDIQLTPVFQYTENARYLWSNGSNEPYTMANSTGQYRVDVSNECGTNSATIRLYNGACKIYVPTAFTPNGDGNNDLFKAEFGENVIKFQLEVFNRWGQRVFNSNDFKKGWDGRIQGLLQPTGVYAWKITYTIYNEPSVKIMKGTTTLIN